MLDKVDAPGTAVPQGGSGHLVEHFGDTGQPAPLGKVDNSSISMPQPLADVDFRTHQLPLFQTPACFERLFLL